MFNNTDNELRRYEEAELYSATATPDMFSDIKSQFNTVTGQTDLMAPLPSGGFVRLASQAPDIMVEAPTMPGMGADAALPVEGPIARAAEQTALETEPATVKRKPMQFSARAGQLASPSAQAEVAKEVTKGLARGGIVEPAQFIDETAGGMGGIQFQIVNPETGEFDPAIRIVSAEERAETQRRMAAGELPFAFDLETLTQADTDASGVAQAAGGIAQFVGAYAGIGKLFRVGSGFKAGMTQGAAADFLGFDGSDASITDMLLEMGVPDEMLPDFLEKDPTDPDYVGRFQAAVEGAGLGAVIEKGLIPILGLAFRAVKDKDVPVDAARQAIQQGKLMMQGALLKAGQNAELRMAERGPAVDFLANTMMSGVDPTVVTDPLVAAAGRAVGDGKMSSKAQDASSKLFRVYHGGPKKITVPEMRSDPEGLPLGFSVTPDKNIAETYQGEKGAVSSFDIDLQNAKIITEMEFYDLVNNLELKLNLDEGEASESQISTALRDAGVDAIQYPDSEFGIRVINPDILTAAGRAVGDGEMSSKAQDAASKLSKEFGVDFNVSNHPTSYGNSTYVSGRIAGPDGTFVDVGFRLSDHSTGDKRKATDDFLTIIDDGEVTAETLVAEVQSQVDKAQPKMQALSEQRQQTDAAQADALDRWSKLSGDERGEIALKFKEIKPGYANNVPWKNLTKQQKADFAAREGLYND